MAEDLTPRVIRSYDSAELTMGGTGRNTTVVQYAIGRFGPFEHVFDRNPSQLDIQQVMQAKAATLNGLV